MIDYSIIIDCPDSYLDILKVFFVFLEKNWKTRSQKIFVTTQSATIDHPTGVEFIKCGFDMNSIQRSKIALPHISSKYILIMDCDDFISKKVDDLDIENLLKYASDNSIKYIRVWKTRNREHKKYKTTFKNLFFCNKKARYSKSLMANFWDKKEYERIFSENVDDGWSIENKWLKESYFAPKGFYSDYCYYSSNPFNIIHSVTKGCWIRKAYRILRKKHISKELLSQRKLLPVKTTIKHSISSFVVNHFSSSFCYKLKRITKKRIGYTSEY